MNIILLVLIIQNTFLLIRGFSTKPIVQVVLLARNKEHTLPYFLTTFETLNYPKNQIALYIRSDHNQDRTSEIIETWLEEWKPEYHSVDKQFNDTVSEYEGSINAISWSNDERNYNMIRWKEESLQSARRKNFDYVWYVDVDVFLTNSDTLKMLINERKPIIAPMLRSGKIFTNFWTEMSDDGWFVETDEYYDILYGTKTGCFPVPLVNSCVLLSLKRTATQTLTFAPNKLQDYDGPIVDIIVFAKSAEWDNVKSYICNKEEYGYIMEPLSDEDAMGTDLEQLSEMKILISMRGESVTVSPVLSKFIPPLPVIDNLGFDQVYIINLRQRTERKKRFLTKLREQGIQGHIVEAVDWKNLTGCYMKNMGMKLVEPADDFTPTYHDAANMLSHINVWKDVVEAQYDKVMVFDDDVGFVHNFRDIVQKAMKEVEDLKLKWEFIFLGRDPQQTEMKSKVKHSKYLINPAYSLSEGGYIVSLAGARKLLHAADLGKMIAIDHFIPIMYDQYPTKKYRELFSPRDLKALAVEPIVAHKFSRFSNIASSDNLDEPDATSEDLKPDLFNDNCDKDFLPRGERFNIHDKIEL